MARFRKGDKVYYHVGGDPKQPVLAIVMKIHRDNSFTVAAKWRVNADGTMDGMPLGYTYRIYTDNLMSRLL